MLLQEEDSISTVDVQLAPSLKALHTFDWDGTEMPPDSLWVALLMDEDSLPDDWIHEKEVLVGIRPKRNTDGIG